MTPQNGAASLTKRLLTPQIESRPRTMAVIPRRSRHDALGRGSCDP